MTLEDGRYIMQLRDDRPGIFYPGHWGCFGGAIDGEESPVAALARELREELELEEPEGPPREFTRFDFDLSKIGGARVCRIYFEMVVPVGKFDRFILHEGAAFEAIDVCDLLELRRVVPYDAFAIWLHARQRSLAA